jgi:hypothetical protein
MLLDCVHIFTTHHVAKFRKHIDGKEALLYPIENDKILNSSIRYSSDNLE